MRDVEAAVRRRVHGDEARDVLKATWADVLSATDVPYDPEEFRRFVFGVARHKVFDHFRRRAREIPSEAADDAEQVPEPLSARDILRWAEGSLPDSESQHTLEWMLREGDGEKLEHIARDANLPAPRVRQRVSRLRRFLRQRWAAELLIGAALVGLGAYVYSLQRPRDERAEPEPTRERTPLELARRLRQHALEHCADNARACVEELDRAKELDPAGDSAPQVTAARRAAAERSKPPLAPSRELPTAEPLLAPPPRALPSSTLPSPAKPKPTPTRPRSGKTDDWSL